MENVTFEKFNDTINYYSKTTRTTGKNVWNQDEVQRQFTEIISNCDLTKEQRTSITSFMVENNAAIDMTPTKNASVKDFNELAKSYSETQKLR